MASNIVVPLLINGEEVTHSSTYDVKSPLTNTSCWAATSASPDDALAAVSAAQAVFPSWSATKPNVRIAILLKAAAIMEANMEEYAGYLTMEMGANVEAAYSFVLPLAIDMCRNIAGRILGICGSVPVVQKEGQSAMVLREPYGVCFGIVPWNAPYVFGIRSAATAIATGNTTVLKGSELTPRCYWAIGKAFAEAGLPAGVLNIISCRPEDAPQVVNAIIEHAAVRKINFTGSASTGRKIGRVCGENLKPCLMELGGKNAAIVCEDADLNKAAEECIAGAFLNAGQICMSTDRILVHEAILPGLLEAMKTQLAASATSKDLPNVVSSASKDRLSALIADALSHGAEIISGVDTQPDTPGTSFVPTILSKVSPSSTLHAQEAFGPLVAISTFATEDQAVDMVNWTEYGLHAAVFTQDLRRGLRIAKRLQVGACHINSMTVHDEPALPMGGVKSSGWGRFNGEEGLEDFLIRRVVTWDD
ncbi:aldehyde dehydrogenase family protein [Pleomassaria siparia CBS 279.74]|uniref:Aldehyde dehydrogenase family protein n=1 Tax=Pleomassaria siparia CBS 279.74 TaxID=1314801 RepID=A0A6G1KBI6_9PLEO|nr:aldehyde dehydrogenase family protein [Pleomassaria siparia CBS 279.74]